MCIFVNRAILLFCITFKFQNIKLGRNLTLNVCLPEWLKSLQLLKVRPKMQPSPVCCVKICWPGIYKKFQAESVSWNQRFGENYRCWRQFPIIKFSVISCHSSKLMKWLWETKSSKLFKKTWKCFLCKANWIQRINREQ